MLKKYDYKIAFGTKVGIANTDSDDYFSLPRLDTRDFPIIKNAKPNKWTSKVIE